MRRTDWAVLVIGATLALLGLGLMLEDGIDSLPEALQLIGLLLVLGVVARMLIRRR